MAGRLCQLQYTVPLQLIYLCCISQRKHEHFLHRVVDAMRPGESQYYKMWGASRAAIFHVHTAKIAAINAPNCLYATRSLQLVSHVGRLF